MVVESDEQNDYIDRCRERGVPVLFGDAADPRLLRRARVDRARRVVAVTGDDGVNAEVAVACRRLVAGRRGAPLDCFVHLVDTHLCQLLYEQELRLAGRDPVRLEFFDVHHRCARALLHEFPFFAADGPTGDRRGRSRPLGLTSSSWAAAGPARTSSCRPPASGGVTTASRASASG